MTSSTFTFPHLVLYYFFSAEPRPALSLNFRHGTFFCSNLHSYNYCSLAQIWCWLLPPDLCPFVKQAKVSLLINGCLRFMARALAPWAPKLSWQSLRFFMEMNWKTRPIRPVLFRTTQLFTLNKSRPRSDPCTQTPQQINVKLGVCQVTCPTEIRALKSWASSCKRGKKCPNWAQELEMFFLQQL